MRKKSLNLKNCGYISFNVLLWTVLLLIVAFAAFRIFCVVNYFSVYVVGTSMEGTLHGAESKYSPGGDYVYAFKSSNPRRGDIVVIEAGGDDPIIKRVIALGGDTVELKAGVLFVNGEKVDEPYVDPVHNTASYSKNTFKLEEPVPEGYMFFLGDNRDASNDSRSQYGVMPLSSIVGIVADWSMSFKGPVTAINSFFDFKWVSARKY